MIKVKLTTNFPEWPIINQTPSSQGTWGNCQFYINDNTEECDWWVIFNGLQKEETVKCDPQNTIFITGEPASIKKYQKKFLDQFNYVITSHRNIGHRNKFLTQQSLPWMIGGNFIEKSRSWGEKFSKNYDELASMGPIKKTKIISIISSNKSQTAGHRQRLKFISYLKESFGDKLDIFGVGNNSIPDKWDGLAPYKYSIVIENASDPHLWTEKLSDAFLAQSFPIYFGCPNIYDYFPKNSLAVIDITNPKEAISQINRIIADNTYEKSLPDILKAKNMVLNKYNLFPSLFNFIDSLPQFSKKEWVTLSPEKKGASLINKIINKIRKYVQKDN